MKNSVVYKTGHFGLVEPRGMTSRAPPHGRSQADACRRSFARLSLVVEPPFQGFASPHCVGK
jgi:hypothetical protein